VQVTLKSIESRYDAGVAPVVVMFPYDIPVGIYGNLQLNISQLLDDE
jgi:hypothetical protein